MTAVLLELDVAYWKRPPNLDRTMHRFGSGSGQGTPVRPEWKQQPSARLGTASLVTPCILLCLGSGCAKRDRPVLPEPPPSGRVETSAPAVERRADASAPDLDVFVEPSRVNPGEEALLTWETQHAEVVFIEPDLGAVVPNGTMRLYPQETVTYTVRAEGPGGSVVRSVNIEVSSVPLPETPADDSSLQVRFNTAVKPVFFGFDSAELSAEARLTLDGNIRWLLEAPHEGLSFTLEGHCDTRGTEEYNLALGDKRARVVKAYLGARGIRQQRMQTVSLGEERPFAAGDEEEDHALNRRVQFVLVKPD